MWCICTVIFYRCGHYDILQRCRYEVARRPQIVESPNLTIRAFLRLEKSEMAL